MDIGGCHGLQAGDVSVDALRVAETYSGVAKGEGLTLGSLPRSQLIGQEDVARFSELGGCYGFRLELVQFREGRLFGVRRLFSTGRDNGQVEQPGVIAQIGVHARARSDLLPVHQGLIHS